MTSLLSNIKRPIVKHISFTGTCSGMAYIYIYIYIYKMYCEENNSNSYM